MLSEEEVMLSLKRAKYLKKWYCLKIKFLPTGITTNRRWEDNLRHLITRIMQDSTITLLNMSM